MKDERFIIRAYGKSELAMLYLPHHTKATALKLFKSWLQFNQELRPLCKAKGWYYTPRQVKKIAEVLGEPFDIE